MNREFFEKRYELNLANEVTTTTARGTSFTGYSNIGVVFSGQLSDAAKAEMKFVGAVEEAKLAPGFGQYLARYRNVYPADTDMSFTAGEPTVSAVGYYGTNHIEGVHITPTQQAIGAKIQWGANRSNIQNLIMDKMEELSLGMAYKVERYIADGISGATAMTNTTRGATVLYAGDKTAASSLIATDTLSVDLVNEAETRLKDWDAYYWNSGVFTLASIKKNPWVNSATDPFVLMISPEMERNLRKSSQFINAAEYGGREVLLSGEIGRLDLFGIRVIVSQFIPKKLKNTEGFDGTTNTVTNTACAILMKGRAAYTFVWGQEPEFKTQPDVDYTSDKLVLWSTYAGSVVHGDAIVKLIVATK